MIRRKLSIVELGQALNNVSDTCWKLGISHQHYYDIRKVNCQRNLRLPHFIEE